ncbi:MAG: hypothetical protein OHK93_006485 [Ramalina farinacea]|uniref:Mitochondrial resolvase Ydc2 catalytic domain-containing protein n=1 Tax=Ramalina farinacea TaxID=258253 RepID=A0AA43TQ49_9LECA|nr:hypothetical protein [Ramalina farinacea]
MSLRWLAHLKGVELRTLATSIGINSSGTKAALTASLETQIPRAALLLSHDTPESTLSKGRFKGKARANVLSIDMGIRNFCYSRFLVPESTHIPPQLVQWERKDIGESPKTIDSAAVKESFEPHVYAALAYDVLDRIFQEGHPSHVLIERQRFRSMGAAAVQEWTLRVNMFEAMLYAVLETLKRQGRWDGDVYGVSPARVAQFWVGGEEVVTKASRKKQKKDDEPGEKTVKTSKSKQTKALKMQLVGKWLRDSSKFSVNGQAQESAVKYQNVQTGKEKQSTFGKLDDLADSVLQGLAWLEWEANRQLISEKGMDALPELQKASRSSSGTG